MFKLANILASGKKLSRPSNSLLRRHMFIETESTPNPHSKKFLLGQEVLPESHGTGMFFQRNDKDIKKSPLAKALFDLDCGVKGIFFGRDFITITKEPRESWEGCTRMVLSEIMDYFASNRPIFRDASEVSDTTVLDTDSEIVASIKELLETRIRPAVQDDGGDIFYEGFDSSTGIVKVRLAGSCVGCPSSSVTLRNGVENMLKHYLPEVTGIEEVKNEEDIIADSSSKLEFHPENASTSHHTHSDSCKH